MSNKNAIARIAAAIADMEKALEATRQEHPGTTTTHIDAKVTALAEVVRNTRRKMNRPAGFDWALHHSYKVIAITPTHLKVEASKGRGSERVLLNIPRSDLSLSTWQVTSIIRRLSAERLLADLNAAVTDRQNTVTSNRKEVTAAEERLQQSERALTEAKEAVNRRLAKARAIEAKRAATRARRNTSAPELATAQ